MSSEYTIRSSPNAVERRSTGQWRIAAGVSATLAGIILVIALVVGGVHVVAQLDSMASNLTRVNSSLATLKTMNRKLDMLSGMSTTLHQMNDKLSVTNAYLATATQRLSSMASDSKSAGSSLTGMRRTLGQMQTDIHEMSHKISRSFLFRSIK
jgi:predicted PurR-regulated permease PerM